MKTRVTVDIEAIERQVRARFGVDVLDVEKIRPGYVVKVADKRTACRMGRWLLNEFEPEDAPEAEVTVQPWHSPGYRVIVIFSELERRMEARL